MRYRVLAVIAAAIALSVVAATATASSHRTAANKLTVWLQVDAQNGWPDIVAATNNAFESSHPGWTVDVQYQQWTTHLQKFDATIAGNDTPDVIEMGNTEMTKYMAAGAFTNITSNQSKFDNSKKWLAGMRAWGTYNGKLYGVPYYAGSRVITYRSDLFKKAGFRNAPKSLSQFQRELVKVGKMQHKKGFSPMYVGGEDWYTALGFVFDFLSEPPHMNIDRPGVSAEGITPDLVEQLLPREHLIEIAGEKGQQLELLGLERQRGAVLGNCPLAHVNHEIAGCKDFAVPRGSVLGPP